MRFSKPTLVMASALFLLAPSSAMAGVDKELREQLSPHVEELRGAEVVQARQVALMTWGLWADRKALKEIEALKSDDAPEVRLGAGLALYIARQRRSEDFVIEQLGADGQLYMTLRERVSLVEDGREAKLLAKFVKKNEKPETLRDVFRYLAGRDGVLFEQLVEYATAKKDSPTRAAAIQALLAAPGPHMIGPAGELISHKDATLALPGVRLAAATLRQSDAERPKLLKLLSKASAEAKGEARLEAVRALLEFNDASAASAALQLAAQTKEDAALRSSLMEAVRDGLARGLKPSMKDVKPLLELELPPGDVVLAHQLAAASGDATIKAKLLGFFTSNTFEERLLAAQALPYTGDKGVGKLLANALFEGDRRMRLYAAQGLEVLADPATVPALQKAISRERDREIKLAVIDALGAIDDDTALRLLRFQVTARDPDIKKHVIAALRVHKKPAATKILDQLLRDRDNEVRWQAFVALLDIAPERGEALFGSNFRSPPKSFIEDLETLSLETRRKVFTHLARHPSSLIQPVALQHMLRQRGRYIEQLRALLKDDSYKESARMTVLAHLSDHPEATDRDLFAQLARADKSERVAQLAAWFIARDAQASMEAVYRGLLASPDPVRKSLAVYGLATMEK